ncbi:MAG: formyltransferase [Thermodesulfatator sp.]|nr:MAG: formyltransferase [Thermodesulfatator sp.]
MSVVLLGYHNMGCRALKVLRELEIEVPAVFTHRDSENENVWFDSLADLAASYSIPCYFPDDINQKKWIDLIRSMEPDVILSCYFRQMIKQDILDSPRVAAVNLHGSLLPKYRGRCPVNWQLVFGEKKSGVTLHHMVLKADAGDIVGQKEVVVEPRDTALTLFRKLEDAADHVLRTYIPMLLDGTAPRIVQDHSKATYFGGRRPEDGRIDWTWDAQRIYNLIRAVAWPYPGAFTMNGTEKLYVWDGVPVMDKEMGIPAGSVKLEEGIPWVQTGKGCLKILSASTEPRPDPEQSIPKDLFKDGMILG